MMRSFFMIVSLGWCLALSDASIAVGSNSATAPVIIDGQSNVWTLTSGVVYENGSPAAYTNNVAQLLYVNGMIYLESSSGIWSIWGNGVWIAIDPTSTRFVDASANVWTLAAGVVYENGSRAGYSANVVQLVFASGVIYQENAAGNWLSWNGSAWIASGGPRANSATPSQAASPAVIAAGYPAFDGQFGVQVFGNQLISTQTGAEVPMIGANVSGLELGLPALWPSFGAADGASWAIVKNWGYGINTVRLPLNEATWLNYQCEDPGSGVGGRYAYVGQSASGHGLYQPDPNGTYKQTVINAVANATAGGLYVILDLHWGAPNGVDGIGICPIGQPGFADADHSLAFWKDVADTFKNNPAVLFELFNEPYGDDNFGNFVISVDGANNNQVGPAARVMRDGGAFSPFVAQNNAVGNASTVFNFSYNVAGMQEMVNTIRGEYAGNVVLTAPVWWATQIQLWTQTQPIDSHGQLAASWHDYGWTGPDSGQDGPLSVLNSGFPLVITEQWNVAGIGGGYSWLLSQNVGFLWWGLNLWNGQSVAAEFSAYPPWFDTADQATPPNY